MATNIPKRMTEKKRAYYITYMKNHPEARLRSLERSMAHYRATTQWLITYKQELGCSLCGERDHRCLDFHHRDPNTKMSCVSMMKRYSLERIKREIDKCDLICSNCHRKQTYDDCQINGFKRHKKSVLPIKATDRQMNLDVQVIH